MTTDWPPRFTFADQTPASAAKLLRQFAETTAAASKNWDNMEAIFEQFITDAYKSGFAAGQKAVRRAEGEK